MDHLSPPPSDVALGLGFYATSTPGISGRLKVAPEDFRVEEISLHPSPDPLGEYTVLRGASRNWEQHELGQRLASVLGLPPNALRWAGTKDRRAVADRLASYRGPPPSRPIAIPGVEVREVYRARDGLVLGHHFGNAFAIRLALGDDSAELALTRAEATLGALRVLGGFPNLYGPQRFGEVRPVTHGVGRRLVQGDVAGAVEEYLVGPPGEPGSPGTEARRAYAEHHDPARALREFPPAFRFERTILDHLARGASPARALRGLSRDLRLLFVLALLSLLFNRWLTLRWRFGLSLTRPEEGDAVLRVARDGTVPGKEAVPVRSTNLEECRDAVARGRARLAGPLVGFDAPPLGGRPAELMTTVLREEGVTPAQFALPAMPELASRGSWRPTWVELPPFDLRAAAPAEGSAPSGSGLLFRYSLPKGSSATVLLSEFLKEGAAVQPEGVPG